MFGSTVNMSYVPKLAHGGGIRIDGGQRSFAASLAPATPLSAAIKRSRPEALRRHLAMGLPLL
jgi:hypothetical protein